MYDVIDDYISVHSKSQLTGFFLTLIFGPLGLLYSNWVASVILTVSFAVTISTIIIPAFCWFISILYSFFAVSKYNQKVRATANLSLIKR